MISKAVYKIFDEVSADSYTQNNNEIRRAAWRAISQNIPATQRANLRGNRATARQMLNFINEKIADYEDNEWAELRKLSEQEKADKEADKKKQGTYTHADENEYRADIALAKMTIMKGNGFNEPLNGPVFDVAKVLNNKGKLINVYEMTPQRDAWVKLVNTADTTTEELRSVPAPTSLDYITDTMTAHPILLDLMKETLKGSPFNVLFKAGILFVRANRREKGDIRFSVGRTFDFVSLYFSKRRIGIVSPAEAEEAADFLTTQLNSFIEAQEAASSDLVYLRLMFLQANFFAYDPSKGGSYIELPGRFKNCHGLTNVRNEDNRCFFYSILALKYPAKTNKTRPSNYIKYLDTLKSDYIVADKPFPADPKEIAKFEEENDCIINVFTIQGINLIPFIPSSRDQYDESAEGKIFNLLIIGDRLDNFSKAHWVAINDLKAANSHRDKSHAYTKYICPRCLFTTQTAEKWEMHKAINCQTDDSTRSTFLKMPTEEKHKFVQFRNHHKGLRMPIMCTMDFESTLSPVELITDGNTKKVREHKPNQCAVYTVIDREIAARADSYNVKAGVKVFDCINDGEDFITKAIEFINKQAFGATRALSACEPIAMTPEEDEAHKSATHCYLCNRRIYENTGLVDFRKVRDHNHITGEYRGAACNLCNVNFSFRHFKLPVFIHNFRGYDSHLLIHMLAKYESLCPIANNSEKYISVSTRNISFVDSIQHINSGLASLVETICKSPIRQAAKSKGIDELADFTEDTVDFSVHKALKMARGAGIYDAVIAEISKVFRHTTSVFGEHAPHFYEKGAIPYDYIQNNDRLRETALPPIEAWTDSMTGQKCNPEDYERYCDIWKALKCKTLLDYQTAYIKSDVSLLADVMENYRTEILHNWRLDPAWYLTAPSLSWDAMLKFTGVRIENMSDIDMYRLVKQNIRGGISVISGSYSRANNKYMPDFNPNEHSRFIDYLDANALYASGMLRSLPIGDYKWENVAQIANLHKSPNDAITSGPDNRFYLVSLHTPENLHDKFNDYPITMSNTCPNIGDLSEYTIGLYFSQQVPQMRRNKIREENPDEQKYSEAVREEVARRLARAPPKLIPSLLPLTRTLIHAAMAKFMVSQGIVIDEIHAIISFTASPFMAAYIEKLQALRKQHKAAGLDFAEQLDKLMGNSVYGKTMEDITKRVDIRLETDAKKICQLTSNFRFKSAKLVSEAAGLFAIERTKAMVVLDKPIAIGFSILEYSKLTMFNFWYNSIWPTYGEKARLLGTDTDSLIFEIETEDWFADIKSKPELAAAIDCSGYHKAHAFTEENKGVYGKFKGECPQPVKFSGGKVAEFGKNGKPNEFVEFIGCRSKMYSLQDLNGKQKATAKGIGKTACKTQCRHDIYRAAMESGAGPDVKMMNFRSYKHIIYTIEQTKRGISFVNDKRYFPRPPTTAISYGRECQSLAHGHYKIPKN